MIPGLWFVRVFALSFSVLIAVAVLGLSANYVSQISSLSIPGVITFQTPAWAKLAVASACATIAFVTPLIIVDFVRKGAFISWIVVEIIVAFAVSVLWLVDALDANSADKLKIFAEFGLPQTCANIDELAKSVNGLEVSDPLTYGHLKAFDFDLLRGLCRQHQLIEGLAYVAWILLMEYSIGLLVLAIRASVHGVPNVWTGTVRDTHLAGPGYQKSVQAASVTSTVAPTPSPTHNMAQGQATPVVRARFKS